MNVEAADREASRWMREGLALIASESEPYLDEAIHCFDGAVEIRRQIVASGRSEYAFGLATGLLNRGDALFRKSDGASLDAALAAFDEGIGLLSQLAWRSDAETLRRLIVGWQNRGLVLQAARRPHDARESFEHALRLLDEPAATHIAPRPAMLAAIWVSLGGVLVEAESADVADDARHAALTALTHIDSALTMTDVSVAESALKARYFLCRALALSLPAVGRADESANDTLHLATDAVDEGLALARHWEQKGVDRFRGLASDLLRFGSRIYARYQPQFLHEFVTENLDPAESSDAYVGSPEIRVARLEALWLSFSRGARQKH